jgi:hypothetical protein
MRKFRAIFSDDSSILILMENKDEAYLSALNDQTETKKLVSVKIETERGQGNTNFHVYRRR